MDAELYHALERRVGRIYLKQRLGIETEREAWIFGQGFNFFHLENWYSVHNVIRAGLRVMGLHGRGRRNARAIRIHHNPVRLRGLPPSFEGLRLLQISDPHLDMHEDFPETLAEALRGLEYDLCVMTGDYRARTYGDWEPSIEAMKPVLAAVRGPVYGVLGNHDSIRMVPGLEELGVRVLLNETVALERDGEAIHLAGIDDPHYYRADNIEKACAAIPDHDNVSILLAHSPEIYRHAAHADFSLMLCGHTHGGQICLPRGLPLMCNARCPRHLCAGAWSHNGMQGYTSRGSGAAVVDVRLNCPPEVVVHTLEGGPQG